jgi:hypothetical protein
MCCSSSCGVVERGGESKLTSGDHWADIVVVVIKMRTLSTTSDDHKQTAHDDEKMTALKYW